jgi:hypothetical protein
MAMIRATARLADDHAGADSLVVFGLAVVIDEVTGSRPAGAALSAGTYLALVALNRLVAPCSKAGFADWWKTTAGDRLAKIAVPALDHRYFWEAMHAVTLEQLEEISRADRFGGLTAYDTRREAYSTQRRTILTHSPELHQSQALGFDGTTLAKGGKKLDELAATLARGKTRRPRAKVEAEIETITAKPWVRRVITWQLTGGQPKDLRLAWSVDPAARAALEEEIFGKHVLITDHDDWPVPEVVAGYRSQSEAEFSFRQMKDPHVVSFSPTHHWTEHNIRVHVFTCVLALQIAHLMRRAAARAGLRLSVRQLLAQLAASARPS